MHKTETDDHAMIKKSYPSLWAFLTTPPRRKKNIVSEMPDALLSPDTKE
jgi:hypothetical protein